MSNVMTTCSGNIAKWMSENMEETKRNSRDHAIGLDVDNWVRGAAMAADRNS